MLQFMWKKDFLLRWTFFPFWNLWKTLQILTYVFNWLYSVSYFPSIDIFVFVHSFDHVSSKIEEVLSINPSANVFVFEDINVHHKDWLSYFDGTDRPGELCYNFSISNDFTEMVNFVTWIPTVNCPVLLFWIYLFLLMLVFVLQWLSLHCEILICSCLSFHWLSNKLEAAYSVSLHSLWLFLCWLGWSSWSFERCSMGGYL